MGIDPISLAVAAGNRARLNKQTELTSVNRVEAAASTDADWTLVLVPDTQYLSQSSATNDAARAALPAWLAANGAAYNIKAVLSLGDHTHLCTSPEMANAKTMWDAVRTACGGVPTLPSPGNHDYAKVMLSGARDAKLYNATFPLSDISGQSWFGGSYNGTLENYFVRLRIGSVDYLILVLECWPRVGVVNWAQGVLDANPTARVILETHSYLEPTGRQSTDADIDGTTAAGHTADYCGQELWTGLVRRNRNIDFVLSGHRVRTAGKKMPWVAEAGDWGNIVWQHFSNYQEDAMGAETKGGGGAIVLMTFRPSLRSILVTTVKTYDGSVVTEGAATIPYPGVRSEGGLSIGGAFSAAQGISTSGDLLARGNGSVDGALSVGFGGQTDRSPPTGGLDVWGRALVGSRSITFSITFQMEAFGNQGNTGNHLRVGPYGSVSGVTDLLIGRGAGYNSGTSNWRYLAASQAASGWLYGTDGSATYRVANPLTGAANGVITWSDLFKIDATGRISASLLPSYANDSAAATESIPVGGLYWSTTTNAMAQRRA